MRIGLVTVGLVLAFAAGWLVRGVHGSDRPRDMPLASGPRASGASATPGLRGQVPEDSSQVGEVPVSAASSAAHDGAASVFSDADVLVGAAGSEHALTDLLSARELIARVRPHLDPTASSYLDLWRKLESAVESGAHDWIFSGSGRTAAARHEWGVFLAAHEDAVAKFLEAAYEHLGRHTLDPDDISMNGLELLAPDLGAHLIATLPVGRFRVLRERLRSLVLRPENQAEGSRPWVCSQVDTVLVAWAASTSAAQARRELAEGTATPAEAVAFLDRIAPDELPNYDRAALSSRLLVSTGSWDQFSRSLGWLYAADSEPSSAALEALDSVVLAFTKASHYTDQPRRLSRYLSTTRRGGWPAAEAFLDGGLETGGHAGTHVPLLLMYLKPAVPPYYIRRVLDRETLLPHVRRALEEFLAK